MSSTVPLPAPGDTIAGRFVVERKLGEGGMGAVFAARSISIGKPVAIKVMLADPAHPESFQRFLNEGRNAASIGSHHVADVDEVGEERGFAFMVMELLEGEDLAQVLERERQLAPHVAVGYVLEALEGVKAAHLKGIVHRDLKPSNLFLAKKNDGSTIVKVLDFGISKNNSALGQAPSALTSTKAMLGSPLYVSPEQVRSSKSVDARTDIWAMGVILYELITGNLPFMGDNLGELFAAILEEPATPLRTRVPAVSPGLEAVVLRCLEKRAENRFQTTQELIDALRPFAAGVQQGTMVLGAPSAYGPGAIPSPAAQTGAMPPPHLAPHQQAMAGTGPQPPQPMMGMTPPGGAITGSGVHPPVVTPQTGDWAQSTGGGVPPKKSVVPIVAGIGAFAVIGVVLAGVALVKMNGAGAKPGTPATLTSAASTDTPPVASAPPPTASAPSTAAAPEPTVAAAAASSDPAAPANAKHAGPSTPSTPTSKPVVATGPKEEPKPVAKPAEPKPAEPKPAEPKPTTKPTTTKPPEGYQTER